MQGLKLKNIMCLGRWGLWREQSEGRQGEAGEEHFGSFGWSQSSVPLLEMQAEKKRKLKSHEPHAKCSGVATEQNKA